MAGSVGQMTEVFKQLGTPRGKDVVSVCVCVSVCAGVLCVCVCVCMSVCCFSTLKNCVRFFKKIIKQTIYKTAKPTPLSVSFIIIFIFNVVHLLKVD